MRDKNQKLAQTMLKIAKELKKQGYDVHKKHKRNYSDIATINLSPIEKSQIEKVLDEYNVNMVSFNTIRPTNDDEFNRVKFTNK